MQRLSRLRRTRDDVDDEEVEKSLGYEQESGSDIDQLWVNHQPPPQLPRGTQHPSPRHHSDRRAERGRSTDSRERDRETRAKVMRRKEKEKRSLAVPSCLSFSFRSFSLPIHCSIISLVLFLICKFLADVTVCICLLFQLICESERSVTSISLSLSVSCALSLTFLYLSPRSTPRII